MEHRLFIGGCECKCPHAIAFDAENAKLRAEILELRRLMGHWSTVDLALKWQEQIITELDAAKAALAAANRNVDIFRGLRDSALLQNGELKRVLHNTLVGYCDLACVKKPTIHPFRREHTEFCAEASAFLRDRLETPKCDKCEGPSPCPTHGEIRLTRWLPPKERPVVEAVDEDVEKRIQEPPTNADGTTERCGF